MKTNQPLGGGLRPAESTEQAPTPPLVMIRLEQADIHTTAPINRHYDQTLAHTRAQHCRYCSGWPECSATASKRTACCEVVHGWMSDKFTFTDDSIEIFFIGMLRIWGSISKLTIKSSHIYVRSVNSLQWRNNHWLRLHAQPFPIKANILFKVTFRIRCLYELQQLL